MRWTISFAVALLSAISAAGQSNPADSQGLDAIRMEIRQLREDLRALVGTAQRAQILIARIQVQDAAVRRAQDRIEESREKLIRLQEEQRQITHELKRNEESLSQLDNPKARKETEDTIGAIKVALEQRVAAQAEAQNRLAESEEQLRIEQAKLGRLQDELDRLDKIFEGSNRH